jgi:arginase
MWTHFLAAILFIPFLAFSHGFGATGSHNIKVSLLLNPYKGDRAGKQLSEGPDILAKTGLKGLIKGLDCTLTGTKGVILTKEEKGRYGRWQHMGLANNHLGNLLIQSFRDGAFPIGLLNNCTSLMGMLGGLQRSGPDWKPLKIGLIWIDAHADYNTPETTLSGMLGGMPVAIATGDCLTHLRQWSGMPQPLPETYVVMMGVRDTDPGEQERLDRSRIEQISVEEIRGLSDTIHLQMKRLSRLTDLIYIHIDMDVLDPAEVSGHSLTVADGPTSGELARALELIFQYKKAAALGIASYPAGRDKDKISLRAAYRLIEGTLKGIKKRKD